MKEKTEKDDNNTKALATESLGSASENTRGWTCHFRTKKFLC